MKYKSQAIWREKNKKFNTKDFDAFQLSEKITHILTTLTEREQRIVRYYLGFDENALSYAKIGKLENICTDYVRQIFQKALRKLRHPRRSDRIKECLTNQ